MKNEIVYKTVGEDKLVMDVYLPPSGSVETVAKRSAVVFYFGGGWNQGAKTQFALQSQHLAERGIVAFCPQYRTLGSHHVTPDVCLQDAKSALRYIVANAEKFGIDPNRIVLGGGSAGGHLAAAVAFCEGFNDPQDDLSVEYRVAGLALFNPVVDNSAAGYGHDRVQSYWEAFSPMHNIKPNMPVLFQLGDQDHLIPIATAEAFKDKIEEQGGICTLKIYKDAAHGFFNPTKLSGPDQIEYYPETLAALDEFLACLGFV